MSSRFLPAALLVSLSFASRAEDTPNAALTFHSNPKPLAEGAVTEDWPHFLGARFNATSRETKLLKKWPEGGPGKVWELAVS